MEPTTFLPDNPLQLLLKHIDPIAVMIVLFGGMIAKNYLKEVVFMNTKWKTLVVGSLFLTLYILVLYISGQLHREDGTKYFISYSVATTFYDHLVKYLLKLLPFLKDSKAKSLVAILGIAGMMSSCTPRYLSTTPVPNVNNDTLILKVSGNTYEYYYADTIHPQIKKWIVRQVGKP